MNNWIWAIGLALQCLLLGVMLLRGAARSLPLFTVLVAVYISRSVFLFAAFGHMSPAAYSLVYQMLSALDVVLQVVVAWELYCDGRQNRGMRVGAESSLVSGSLPRHLAVFCMIGTASAAAAWGISRVIPASPHSPIDRGVLFPSLLMIGVAAVVAFGHWNRPGSIPRRVLFGFAFFGAVSVASQIGRTLAGLHRDGQLFARWSYAEAFAYIAVLLFWLAATAWSRQDAPAHRVS